jgi:hypothetical protein
VDKRSQFCLGHHFLGCLNLREVFLVFLSFQCTRRLLSPAHPSFSRRRMSHRLCSPSVPPAHQQGKHKSQDPSVLGDSFLPHTTAPGGSCHLTPFSYFSFRLTSASPALNYNSSVSCAISLSFSSFSEYPDFLFLP